MLDEPIRTTVSDTATRFGSTLSDDRWKSVLSFIQFILGTVIVGVFGTIINNRIQTRDIEIKEQEQIFKNLATVLSSNPADKLLMAEFYATVTRSDEIRQRWADYREALKQDIASQKNKRADLQAEIARSSDAKVIEQKQNAIHDIDAQITPTSRQVTTTDPTPARVYFHISNENQRSRAAHVATALSQNGGVLVPGVELVGATPSSNQLRYFRPADATEATAIARLLDGEGIPATPTYVRGYEASTNIRPRHFELWIANGWN